MNFRIRKIDANTGIIKTIAGNGTAGYGGDGGLAASAILNGPQDIFFDKNGNLLFSDYANYRIRKIDTSGIISTIVGNGSYGYTGDGGMATSSEIQDMIGICADSANNLYFSQRINYVVRKINHLGIIATIAGNGTLGPSGDGGPAISAALDPERIAIDKQGNLYISEVVNNLIRKIDTAGIITTIAGTGTATYGGDNGPATAAAIYTPVGLVFDECGNLYFADEDNNRIRKIIYYTPPPPIISLTSSPNDTVYFGTAVTYTTAIAGGTGISYQWVVNGTVVADSNNSSYIYVPHNRDSVRCVVICAVKCMSGIDTISTNSIHMVVWPLGINDIPAASAITIYPYPATTHLTITASTQIKNITISNLLGQPLIAHSYNTQKAEINIASLPAGVYMVRVNGTYVQRLVKD